MGRLFETDRLVVRAWTEEPADVARVYDMLSRWEVARWLGARPRALEDPAEALATVRRWRARAGADGRHGVWAVETKGGTTVGAVLVVPLPGPDDRPTTDVEIGWHLHPDSWGRGYATEAAGPPSGGSWTRARRRSSPSSGRATRDRSRWPSGSA